MVNAFHMITCGTTTANLLNRKRMGNLLATSRAWGPTLNGFQSRLIIHQYPCCLRLVFAGQCMLQCREEWSLNVELWFGVTLFLFYLPDAVVKSARRGAAGAFAIFVIHAAVAGAHEQTGLREPLDGAAQVRAIDGEYVELIFKILVAAEVADIHAGLRGDAVPRLGQRIFVGHDDFQLRLAFGKCADWAERDPRLFFAALHRGGQIANAGDSDQGRGDDAAQAR